MTYIFLTLIALGYIINKLSHKYTLKNIHFSRKISKQVVEIDEEIDLIITTTNKKPLPLYYLHMIMTFPKHLRFKTNVDTTQNYSEEFHLSSMSMLPYQKIKRTYKIYFDKRGRYILGDTTLLSNDFIGFNSLSDIIHMNQEIIVLSKTINLNKYLVPRGSYSGDISVKRWIIDDPTMIVGVRKYTGLEPQKYIHWSSSLKTGQLMVKQFDFTSDNSSLIILNIETSKPSWLSIEGVKIEKCISIARTLIEDFEKEKLPYGISTNAQINNCVDKSLLSVPGSTNKHYYDIIETLAKIPYDTDTTFERLLQNILNYNYKYKTYIIITPYLFEDEINLYNKIAATSAKTVVISLDEKNIYKLSNNILVYTEGKE